MQFSIKANQGDFFSFRRIFVWFCFRSSRNVAPTICAQGKHWLYLRGTGVEIYRENQLLSRIRKAAMNRPHRTHSWIVHSGILSGICPLFSRLQSSSSPEHTQGDGQVLTAAPDAHWSPPKIDRITAKPTKLRGCVKERIFPLGTPTKKSRERKSSLLNRCVKNPKGAV